MHSKLVGTHAYKFNDVCDWTKEHLAQPAFPKHKERELLLTPIYVPTRRALVHCFFFQPWKGRAARGSTVRSHCCLVVCWCTDLGCCALLLLRSLALSITDRAALLGDVVLVTSPVSGSDSRTRGDSVLLLLKRTERKLPVFVSIQWKKNNNNNKHYEKKKAHVLRHWGAMRFATLTPLSRHFKYNSVLVQLRQKCLFSRGWRSIVGLWLARTLYSGWELRIRRRGAGTGIRRSFFHVRREVRGRTRYHCKMKRNCRFLCTLMEARCQQVRSARCRWARLQVPGADCGLTHDQSGCEPPPFPSPRPRVLLEFSFQLLADELQNPTNLI